MYRIKRRISLILILCLAFTLFSTSTVVADSTVTVSINAPTQVLEDQHFIAQVAISDVEDFDATDYKVTFDENVLEVEDVTAGDIGGTVIPVDVWNPISADTIVIVQNVPGLSGVTGSGYLAEIHFHVIGSSGDTSQIDLHDGTLGNRLAQAITATWLDGSVTVGSTVPPVPELQTIFLFGIGLIGIIGYLGYRRYSSRKRQLI